jgi:integrase/recombinase XerD
MPLDPLIHPDIERYIDAMWMEKGLSNNTLSSYRRDLRQFNEWLLKRDGSTITQASPPPAGSVA